VKELVHFEEIYTSAIPTLITTSSVCDSEDGLLQASVSSSVETVGLDMEVHKAPIVSEVIESGSTESIEAINVETNVHMDPGGKCVIIAEDNMLIKNTSILEKCPLGCVSTSLMNNI
jgi:hypothetical protein